MVTRDTFFMQQAIALAQKAKQANEVPIGAVVVINNEIIGTGFNCPIATCDPTAHAEIIALRQAAKTLNNYRLLNTSLYVTVEPCLMCTGAMLHARIKRLIFGATDPKTGAVISVCNSLDTNQLNHKIQYQHGILAAKCSKIISDFFKLRRYIN